MIDEELLADPQVVKRNNKKNPAWKNGLMANPFIYLTAETQRAQRNHKEKYLKIGALSANF